MRKFLFAVLLLSFSLGIAQSSDKNVHVKFITENIKIDGVLDERPWGETKPATNFWQYFPSDTIHAEHQTEIHMMFDDKNLYLGIKSYSISNNFITPSLRRDFRASGNDNITLIFDTFNDGTNAFMFGTNPHGVRREALISGGGTDISGFNTTWDTKWQGESTIHEDHYIAELMIPLSAFKYREGETQWRFNSYQFDTQDNTRNTWMHIPKNQWVFSLAHMGKMIFEKPLGKSKSPISIIPFVNTLSGKDYETNQSTNDFKIGGDAKFTIGNSLSLDVTVNPDFSQVEVDQQVTNLTRFEVSLPEKRQFFIENSDLFSGFGDDRDAKPFFSRRIGIAKDKDGNSIENNIIGGVRLSGKLNNNFRIGILNMQTAEDLENEIPTTNNAVISVQQKLFSRSNISAFVINKQSTKNYDFLTDEERYNRVVGIDYNLASSDNLWNGRYFFHKSFSHAVNSKDFATGAATTYNSNNYNIRLSGVYVGDNFRSDLGFIRRTDILKINPKFQRNFWPKKGSVQGHSLAITPIVIWRPELNYENSDYTIISKWELNFQNTAILELEMFNRYIHLYDDFDPTGNENAVPIPGDHEYYYTSFGANYQSDRSKNISFQLEPSMGNFFNGKKYSMEAQLNLRLQPHFTTSVQVNYDNIQLPNPHSNATIWLIGPKFDVTFNKKLFWATFIQYSNQRENLSINTRLQWRFAPLSDLFFVYNDNYNTYDAFTPRVRSLNLKLKYWLNI